MRRTTAFSASLAMACGLGLTALPAGGAPAVPAALLAEPAVDEEDASIKLGLTPYHEIAPRLNAIQEQSDRMTTEVIGTSVGGRDIIMVSLTEAESDAQARQQARMRDRITGQPAQAARDRGLARSYKVPVLLVGNIHGNEWEGTDALLRLVEEYATSTDPAVAELLSSTTIHLVITANPDGRVDNTRRNADGFDLNRDLVTATQPETVAVRDAIVRTQPALLLDLHGYVNGTLVEPTTPPHGEAYEFDLLVKHAHPVALAVEEAVNGLGHDADDGVRRVQIPLRDWEEGWDGWPPIFTPQYAALHGAVAHTIEIPLRVNNASYDLPEAELRRRAAINTDIAHASVTASLEYVDEHREDLLADHIEIFRRGASGERQTPVEEGLYDVIGPEDVYLTSYPRAYVIPVGEGQRSAPAAARLVDFLVANGVQVTRLHRPTTLAGRSHPPGSYVVDMHQARRAVAQTLLGRGTDISERVDAMYDISGWSHALLWGADVVTVPEGDPLRIVSQPVTEADETGELPDSDTGWVLPLTDIADARALTTLLEQGVPVELLDDGTVHVPAQFPWAAFNAADSYGAQLSAAPEDALGVRLEPSARIVGAAGTPEERFALAEMGFTVRPVSTSTLNDGQDLGDLDALYVSADLAWGDLDEDAQAELRAFVGDGGGLVARGRTGAALNDALEVLDLTAESGRSDANGVVRVESEPESPVTAAATGHTLVYSPMWFTGLGEGVRADQRYTEDPLVGGHWGVTAEGTGGPEEAAGEAAVVSGESTAGARGVLFGTEPLFRAHPKGQYSLVARALIWVGVDG